MSHPAVSTISHEVERLPGRLESGRTRICQDMWVNGFSRFGIGALAERCTLSVLLRRGDLVAVEEHTLVHIGYLWRRGIY